MYGLVFYDVDKKRVAKIHRYFEKKLYWVQNSAFEGEIGELQRDFIFEDIRRILDPEQDTMLFVWTRQKESWRKVYLGINKQATDILV
jgi:CRISPR-associated protein Cas2